MSTKCVLILLSSLFLLIFSVCEYSFVFAQGLSWDMGQSMPTNRTEITSEIIDNKIYVLGGANYLKDGIMNVVEIYDPSNNTWTQATPLPIAIDHTATVSYKDKLFPVGGYLEDKNPTDKLWIYYPSNNTWTEGAPLSSPRGALAAEVVNGTIYAIGGTNSTHDPVTTTEAYDIETNTWSFREPLTKPKHHIASAVVDGKIYILGGRILGNGIQSEINE